MSDDRKSRSTRVSHDSVVILDWRRVTVVILSSRRHGRNRASIGKGVVVFGPNVYILSSAQTALTEQEVTVMPFTRMDEGKVEDWMAIGTQVSRRQSTMPATIKSMLAQLEQQVDGFAVNQLVHGLQTATRAELAGASEELIVAALCHDIGKVISVENLPG